MDFNLKEVIPAIKIYVMVGVPGSGKSTWCQQNLPDAVYISRDQVRYAILKEGEEYFSREKEVFARFVSVIKTAFQNRQTMVVDATHLNKPSRDKLTRSLQTISIDTQINYDIHYVVMDISLQECLRRNSLRTGRACVPDSAIKSMFMNFTIPTFAENTHIKEIKIIREETL